MAGKAKRHEVGYFISDIKNEDILIAVKNASSFWESSINEHRKALSDAFLSMLQIVADPTNTDIIGCSRKILYCLENFNELIESIEKTTEAQMNI